MRTAPELLPPNAAPPPIVVPPLWTLGAQPAALARAAAAWRDLGTGTASAQRALDAMARALLAAWEGDSAVAYQNHHGQVSGALAESSTVVGRVASTVDELNGVLTAAQEHLDASWRRVRRAVPARVTGTEIVFTPDGPAGSAHVAAAVAEAE